MSEAKSGGPISPHCTRISLRSCGLRAAMARAQRAAPGDTMDSFIADYHEAEEAFPLVYDLGRLSLEWNMVEQFFTALIWEFLGDYPTGIAVTGGMGNRSKADVILKLSRDRIGNSDVVDRVEFACKVFNILRENRNMLMHSHSIF